MSGGMIDLNIAGTTDAIAQMKNLSKAIAGSATALLDKYTQMTGGALQGTTSDAVKEFSDKQNAAITSNEEVDAQMVAVLNTSMDDIHSFDMNPGPGMATAG